MENQTKKKRSFPTAYTVIVIVLLLVQAMTFFIPSGKYSTLGYDSTSNSFVITDAKDETSSEPATKATLDKYGIKVALEKFTDGTVYKPVAIPNSYQEIAKPKRGVMGTIKQFLESQVLGIVDSIDIIVFILILGGVIGVINATGAMDSGMMRLSEKMNNKQKWLIVIITTLIALGGTTFGLAEETVAFYPILVPIFLMAGYDTLTAVASIYLGTAVGSMISTVNPFSVVIASNSAGISFGEGMWLRMIMWLVCVGIAIMYTIRYGEKVRKNPSSSLVYDQMESDKKRFIQQTHTTDKNDFTLRKKLTLVAFVIAFIVMIVGVQQFGWYFTEISIVFLALTYILVFLAGLGEKDFVNSFVSGAADLLGVALIVGLARSVSIVMENSFVSDTVMFKFSELISGMNSVLFICVLYFVYIILGFFIQSSSGLAVLSMPIMAPLADVVGIDRSMVVDAYNWGQGIIGLIAPTGLILVSLALVDVSFDKWLKFVWKLLVALIVIALVALSLGVLFT